MNQRKVAWVLVRPQGWSFTGINWFQTNCLQNSPKKSFPISFSSRWKICVSNAAASHHIVQIDWASSWGWVCDREGGDATSHLCHLSDLPDQPKNLCTTQNLIQLLLPVSYAMYFFLSHLRIQVKIILIYSIWDVWVREKCGNSAFKVRRWKWF